MTGKKSPAIHFIMKEKVALQNRQLLRRQLLTIFGDRQRQVEEINYLFCSNEEILQANQQFLGHHYTTDIITFDYTEAEGGPVVADILIGVDTVRANALQYNESFERELHRVLFHGALHLCGFDDRTSSDQQEMRKMEDHYLSAYFSHKS